MTRESHPQLNVDRLYYSTIAISARESSYKNVQRPLDIRYTFHLGIV